MGSRVARAEALGGALMLALLVVAVSADCERRSSGTERRRSPDDREPGEALRLLLVNVDAGNRGAAGTLAGEADQGLDRLLLALEHRLHRAVVAVADPAGDPARLGHPADSVAKENSLHPATNDDVPADHLWSVAPATTGYSSS
jgi:hypothetical protein